jgi:hypothetical protein
MGSCGWRARDGCRGHSPSNGSDQSVDRPVQGAHGLCKCSGRARSWALLVVWRAIRSVGLQACLMPATSEAPCCGVVAVFATADKMATRHSHTDGESFQRMVTATFAARGGSVVMRS